MRKRAWRTCRLTGPAYGWAIRDYSAAVARVSGVDGNGLAWVGLVSAIGAARHALEAAQPGATIRVSLHSYQTLWGADATLALLIVADRVELIEE